jgi:hypothetical protein
MDELGFNLSNIRRIRCMAPRSSSIKTQSSLATQAHITVIAAISTSDAPLPPSLPDLPGLHLNAK